MEVFNVFYVKKGLSGGENTLPGSTFRIKQKAFRLFHVVVDALQGTTLLGSFALRFERRFSRS